jgi:hypothetical protein
MNQNKDIQYANLLKNLWTWNILDSYFNLLKTFLNFNFNLFDNPWNIATYMVLCNELRNAINRYMIDIYSKKSKQNVMPLSQLTLIKMSSI